MRLYANPYDISKHGFYFKDLDQYEDRYKQAYKQSRTEEYEIDFIDGTDKESAIFKVADVNQANVGEFFDAIDELESYELPAFYYHLSIGLNMAEARAQTEDESAAEGTLVDRANEMLDEGMISQEQLVRYFDAESFGRDLELGGDMTEFSFGGTTYTIWNH